MSVLTDQDWTLISRGHAAMEITGRDFDFEAVVKARRKIEDLAAIIREQRRCPRCGYVPGATS